MKVVHFNCGPAANESELKAFEHLKNRLASTPGDDHWVILTNLAFSVNHQLQADEIDIVVIGPQGVRVLEVKHWNAQWIRGNRDLLEREVDRVTDKAKKIATTLRKKIPKLPYVSGAILLTREPSELKRLTEKKVRGVHLHTLKDWKAAINFEPSSLLERVLSNDEVHRLSRVLEPRSGVALDGSLRRLGGYVKLEQLTKKDDRFHRIYKGIHSKRQDKVILHLYDLTTSGVKNAEIKACRAFDVLLNLQRYDWAPRILDSYQDAPGYSKEMYFFTLIDPAAPTLVERATDPSWGTIDRVVFARNAIRALKEMHKSGPENEPILHRNLSPQTVSVKHDNKVIFSDFGLAKIPSDLSVASVGIPAGPWDAVISPEVRAEGLGAADHRSDIYSLCASLAVLFEEQRDENAQNARPVLQQGLPEKPDDRCTLESLDNALSRILGDSIPLPAPPPARFWTEDQIVPFGNKKYRIIARVGSGGVGTAFKIVEIDRESGEDLGTYIGKVTHDRETGNRVLKAHNMARSHLGRHAGLSTIYETASQWEENEFIALLTWIEGTPLAEWTGVFQLLAENLQVDSPQDLALTWLSNLCDALDSLHRKGLIHGDVSLRNIILSGNDLVLTDYDFVGKIGAPVPSPGTLYYSPPSQQGKRLASSCNDIYALAASFFHFVFDKLPFQHDGIQAKERGLNWDGVDHEAYPVLVSFLDKATHPDPEQRFSSGQEAFTALLSTGDQKAETEGKTGTGETKTNVSPVETEVRPESTEWREERVAWLKSLLQSYPGSRWGNQETRGLDTDFSARTYVETNLEEVLFKAIQERAVRLVILCGNAGDGKTALLQHLGEDLGLGRHKSAERILEGKLKDGLVIRMNLDGSASWQGRSADEILNKFLKPFQQGPPVEDIVHLLAINDGRLLEWIETVESSENSGATPLTEKLSDCLQKIATTEDDYIRFIHLNERSLVGGVKPDRSAIQSDFLEKLLRQLYGGDRAAEIWKPCSTCSAQTDCEVFRARKVFDPNRPEHGEHGDHPGPRERLFAALQAVHLRGEVHITTRELRAALVYILFGVHDCSDYHKDEAIQVLPYWDRAFDPSSPGRQGEVLQELARFDPALEAHPQIDRHLLGTTDMEDSKKTAPRYGLPLVPSRRRAYFEWTREQIIEITGKQDALGLARGQHLHLFRNLSLANEEMNNEKRKALCTRLCKGISRLEDLPAQALDQAEVVPFQITPRTPTETAFWVEKSIENFRLEAMMPSEAKGIDRLHRQARLIYRYKNGQEEGLQLGAELFHLLLELSDGYQLGDVSTDDTFARLSIFVQRLVREDEQRLLAWNPMEEETIFTLSAQIGSGAEEAVQKIVLKTLLGGEGE